VVPARLAHRTHALRHSPMGEQRDEREQAQQRGRRPPDRRLRPLPLGFYPEVPTHLLESYFHLPAHDEPRQDPFRLGREVSAQQRLGSESALRVAHQHPTQWYRWQSRVVPDRRFRSDLEGTLSSTVPVGDCEGPPEHARIFSHDRERGQTLALETGPSYLAGSARRGRFVERGIQAQEAGYHGDGLREAC
jgi:hypothetical protein